MKRFTETTKWRDPWFRRLSPHAKLLWQYLCDHCDNAGVVDVDLEDASFSIGASVSDQTLTELETRFQRLANGKLWIKKFCVFQFGELQPTSLIHKSVIKLLASHGISHTDGVSHANGIPMGCKSHKEKEKVQRKEKEGGGAGGRAVKTEAKAPAMCDAEWLESLQKDPTYHGIDVGREYGKMLNWCKTNRKQPTRRRFQNWLNRCDTPMVELPLHPKDERAPSARNVDISQCL